MQAYTLQNRCGRSEGHLLHCPPRASSASLAAEAKRLSCLKRAMPSSSLQVLHIDRNNYYGGQSASLNLNQVCKTSLCTACSLLLLLCIHRLQQSVLSASAAYGQSLHPTDAPVLLT